jgi:hypothetical protein
LPSLISLDLQDCSVTDDVLAAVGLNCPKLQSLITFYGNAVTDVGVEAVLEGCPLLRGTDVWYATGVSHELRVELARRANLTELRLGSWLDLDDELLQGLMQVCPQLTELVVLDTSQKAISDKALAECAQHCPLLLEFRMDAGNAITSAGAVHFFRAQSNLRVIAFESCHYVNDAVVTAIAQHCPQLQEFRIIHSERVTATSVVQLFLPDNRLRRVQFRRCSQVGDEVVLAAAQYCPQLESADFSCMRISDGAVVKLAVGCPLLQEVTLDETGVCDRGVTALATHCRHLTLLDLSDCSGVTLQGVSALAVHGTELVYVGLPWTLRSTELPRFRAHGVNVIVQ